MSSLPPVGVLFPANKREQSARASTALLPVFQARDRLEHDIHVHRARLKRFEVVRAEYHEILDELSRQISGTARMDEQ